MKFSRITNIWKYLIIILLDFVSRIFGSFLFFTLCLVLFGLEYEQVNALKSDNHFVSYLSTFAQVAPAVLTFLLIYRFLHPDQFQNLLFNQAIRPWFIVKIGLFFIVIRLAVEVFIIYGVGSDITMGGKIDPLFPSIIMGMTTLIVASTFEEIVFRGYLLRSLANYSNKPILSSIVVSFIFTLVHWTKLNDYPLPWVEATNMFIWSYFVCILTIKSQRLDIAIGVHIFYNLSQHFILGNTTRAILVRPFPGGLYGIVVIIISFGILYYYLKYSNNFVNTENIESNETEK